MHGSRDAWVCSSFTGSGRRVARDGRTHHRPNHEPTLYHGTHPIPNTLYLYPIPYTLYPVHVYVHVYPIPYTLYPIPYTLYPIPYTLLVYPIPYTKYPTPYQGIPYTLYPIPYLVYPIPYTLYPIPNTLYPIPTLYPPYTHPPTRAHTHDARTTQRTYMLNPSNARGPVATAVAFRPARPVVAAGGRAGGRPGRGGGGVAVASVPW